MSSATTSVTAYTKQSDPVPQPGSENAPVPEELWIVLILSFILLVLLAWRAIDEMVDGSGNSDNDGSWFAPL